MLQRNFDLVMSQNTGLSGELDALRDALTRLQSSANQALADLSEKEAELRIQKRERFECESKLYAAATEHDRMKSEAHALAARMQQVPLLLLLPLLPPCPHGRWRSSKANLRRPNRLCAIGRWTTGCCRAAAHVSSCLCNVSTVC